MNVVTHAAGVSRGILSLRDRAIVLALAQAAIPQGEWVAGGGEATVFRLEEWLTGIAPGHTRAFRGLLWGAEMAAVATTGTFLSKLPRERAMEFLESWAASGLHVGRSLLRALLTPIKAAHFDDPSMFAQVGCPSFHGNQVPQQEQPRWMSQVTDGRGCDADLELECEVVVIGTGAGGAACAYELASRGRAVLLLEEGDFHRRSGFTGRSRAMVNALYRDRGFTVALGNVGIPVFAGRAVGGSTTVNSGTCYRAPERIFRKWREEHGLVDFSASTMAPYYDRVESMLQVERASRTLTGGVGRVISRGADALGLRHLALLRNAPGCDGQGVCAFGCPTGAKRSADVSYVPEALLRGAQLVTGARVEQIAVEKGRARGVMARLASGRRLRARADAVVVAGGALMTPGILRSVLRSPALGKHLSIHPASKVMAVFDEAIDMGGAIPQGYAIEEYAHEGIMFEGASTPLDMTAVAVPWVGRRFVRVMESYRQLATFGFMIEDTSRGEVRPGQGGSPRITYNLNTLDTAKMAKAMGILCEVFLAAGARRVFPFLPGQGEITSNRDLAKLRARDVAPGDLEVTAYHPLGTARIGTDRKTSVCGANHETHEVERLYVVDSSSVPSSLGVNPQLTIMAMAHRAAELLDVSLG